MVRAGGGIHQDVDASKFVDDPLDHRLDLGAVAQVDFKSETLPTGGGDLRRSLVRIGLRPVHTGDVGAFGRKARTIAEPNSPLAPVTIATLPSRRIIPPSHGNITT